MNRLAIVLGVVVLLAPLDAAHAQSFNARRTAMGGVVLPGGGQGAEGSNVAYRAVPSGPGTSFGIPLPIGLVPLLSNPPSLDPDDPEFNIYELADIVYNPPWNLQLVSPEPPSSDIVVELGKNHLAIGIGEVAALFPDQESRIVGMAHGPSLGFGFRNVFVAASALVHYQNRLDLSPELHAAIAQGQAFQSNTTYSMNDDVLGQTAAALELGWAGGVFGSRDADAGTGSKLYAGMRTKLLRGLAYADAQNWVGFTTDSVLFSSSPIDLDFNGLIRQTGPGGGSWGRGLDLGMVWASPRLEMGVGLNNVATRLDWRVEESLAHRDTSSGEVVRQVLREDVAFTSELPVTGTVNAALRFGRATVAGDVVRSLGYTTAHLGSEYWLGWLALRAGGSVDARSELQGSGGVGMRLGRFGLDLAVASHSRTLSGERGVELGAGFSLYR